MLSEDSCTQLSGEPASRLSLLHRETHRNYGIKQLKVEPGEPLRREKKRGMTYGCEKPIVQIKIKTQNAAGWDVGED